MLTICSWNINGIRATIKTGDLQRWLTTSAPDIVGMQEVKATSAQVEEAGRNSVMHRTGTRPNARATAVRFCSRSRSRSPSGWGSGSRTSIPKGALSKPNTRRSPLLTSYFPNAGKGEARMAYKHAYYGAFLERVDALKAAGKSVIFMGDFNVAHTEIDLARPEEALKGTGFLPEERVWIDRIIEHGYVDTFRTLHPEARDAYSYWDAWRDRRARNIGWRIDYVFVSADLMPSVKRAFIQPEVMGSDHCPVGIELDV